MIVQCSLPGCVNSISEESMECQPGWMTVTYSGARAFGDREAEATYCHLDHLIFDARARGLGRDRPPGNEQITPRIPIPEGQLPSRSHRVGEDPTPVRVFDLRTKRRKWWRR